MPITFNYKGAISGDIFPDYIQVDVSGFGSTGCDEECHDCGWVNGSYQLAKIEPINSEPVEQCWPEYYYEDGDNSILIYFWYGGWYFDLAFYYADGPDGDAYLYGSSPNPLDDVCEMAWTVVNDDAVCFCGADEYYGCGSVNHGVGQTPTAVVSEV
jgi:hypothetical protein